MLHNYVLAALRGLKRQSLFAIINISGLAIGLAACTLIVLFVKHEFSYDEQFSKLDRLYRIEATANIPGQTSNESPQFFGPSYDLLPKDYAEIKRISRLQQRGGTVVSGDSSIAETFSYVDPEFLSMFDLEVIEGSRAGALDTPSKIVLTREIAEKHLGPRPWVGKTVAINQGYERELSVSAVLADLPANTHFDIDVLVPMDERVFAGPSSDSRTDFTRWNGLPFYVYIELGEAARIERLRATINVWVDKYFPPEIQALVGIPGSELFTPRIVPVRDIHMYSPVQFDMKPPGSITTIFSFAGVAFLILSIACINFMNLATSASSLRAKEIAMRKVMGAKRHQLFLQFETESVILAFIGLFFALVLIELLLPSFGDYTERHLEIGTLFQFEVASLILVLTLLVGLIAGSYPAMVLSGQRPARVLRAGKSNSSMNSLLRSVLVLFQFSISAALINLTVLIYVQTEHARSANLGYNNQNTMTVRGVVARQLGEGAETYAQRISAIPGVTHANLTSFTPGDGVNTGLSLKVPGQDQRIIIFYRAVYPGFFEQFVVEPVAGRLLGDDYASDRTTFISDPNSTEEQRINVVVNEMAARELGFSTPEDAIGKVYYRGQQNQIVNTIVGVVPNIHFSSPRSEVDSEIYMYIPLEVNNLLVTFEAGQFAEINKRADALFREMFPLAQAQVQHLQENIADQYREEEVIGTLLGMFSMLAVLIACMGLFGLASFTISQRTREIGIRKVMGASSREIVLLLVSQFSRPVILANIITWPLCWYLMDQWLMEFSHRIDLVPWFTAVGLGGLLMTLLLAWTTVAGHAIRVSRTNPVYALRYD